MNFKNIEKFETWLKENLKASHFYLDLFLKDVEEKSEGSERESYELNGYETKSGNPCEYYYNVENIYFKDGKEVEPCSDFDYIESTIIF